MYVKFRCACKHMYMHAYMYNHMMTCMSLQIEIAHHLPSASYDN